MPLYQKAYPVSFFFFFSNYLFQQEKKRKKINSIQNRGNNFKIFLERKNNFPQF